MTSRDWQLILASAVVVTALGLGVWMVKHEIKKAEKKAKQILTPKELPSEPTADNVVNLEEARAKKEEGSHD